jgi:hypothetical protein
MSVSETGSMLGSVYIFKVVCISFSSSVSISYASFRRLFAELCLF